MRLGTFQGCTLYSQSTNRTAKHGRHKQNRNLPPISLITKHLLLHIKREWESVAKGYFFTMQSVTLYSAKGNLLQHKRLPLESQPDTTANSRALSPPHRSSYIPPDCLLLPECRYMSSALRRCISDCGRNLLQHGQRNLRQCRTPHH